jgi:hypothetical protein
MPELLRLGDITPIVVDWDILAIRVFQTMADSIVVGFLPTP